MINKKDFKVDFIGIGAEKAGTYWVADCLREHPGVCFSSHKEIAFFNEFDQHFLKFYNPRYNRGIGWYKRFFENCEEGSLKGEFTPTYLYSETAAWRIKKYFPNVKLIVVLREPVSRAFSQYLHDESTGVIRRMSFEKALIKYDGYVEKGLYYKNLKKYYNYFSKKQILVLLTNDIADNPGREIKKIYKFLELKNINFRPPSLNMRPNPASYSRFTFVNYILLRIEYLLFQLKLYNLHQFLEDLKIRRALFLFSYYSNRKPLVRYPQIKDKTERELKKTFELDINKLEKLIDYDLTSWKKY